MKEYFLDILKYNFDINEKLLQYFEDNQSLISEKAHLLLTHLINAQHLWNKRIISEELVYGIWETLPFEKLHEINLENFEISKKILATEDLEKTIYYKNIKGEDFQRKLKDIIFHYTNHSTYHRAQIATELKNSGLEPIITDYIYYKS